MTTFICPICNTVYKIEDGEIIDTKDEETGEDDKLLICRYCEKIMNVLRRHDYAERTEEALEDMWYDVDTFVADNMCLLRQKRLSELLGEISKELDEEEKRLKILEIEEE